jgi:phosphoenolpyruvate synthase/pyruvate phosphate dikinase
VAASPGVAAGVVRNVQDRAPELMAQIRSGEVLVAPTLMVYDYSYMEKASAFVLNLGGSARGIDFVTKVARKTGRPAVVATGEATSVLKDGQNVVVDGDEGAVYAYKAKTTS